MRRPRSCGQVRRSSLLALLSVLVLMSCALRPQPSPAPAETRVVIFHSNDVHGKIDNFAKVAAVIDAERKSGAQVFYFNAGDNFTGNPIVDQYEPPGEPIREILGRLGLDVLCPGNHEFDYGLLQLRKLAARFATVSANIEAGPDVFPELKSWVTLKTRDGVRLVVFGLIQVEPGNGLPSTHPYRVRDLRFSEPLGKAREMRKLRAQGEVLIGLTHIGHEQDRLLAEQMPELDLIIGGHSHTRVDPAETVNGVLVAQAGGDNQFLGRIDLRLKKGRLVEKKGVLIDLRKPLPEDETVKGMIAQYNQNSALNRVIARSPLEISGKHDLGSLITDAIRRAHGLDIAFHNNGAIRLDRLPLDITLKDVYSLDPFGNHVIQVDMTPDEIRSLLKNSWEKRKDIDLQVSGMSYVIREDGARQVRDIRMSLPDGSPLAEDRVYKVGLSSYIVTSYSFAHRDPGRSLQTIVADDLINYLQSGVDLGGYRGLQRAFLERPPDPPRD